MLVAGGGIYLGRYEVAATLGELYLLARGVPSDIQISRLDRQAVTACVRLGSKRTPDLVIERIHLELGGGFIPTLRKAQITKPELRLGFDGEKISFGTLQRLIGALADAPADNVAVSAPSAAPAKHVPPIIIEQARIKLFTPAGVVMLSGDGRLKGGRVEQFSARISRAHLRHARFAWTIEGGAITGRIGDGGLHAVADLRGRSLRYETHHLARINGRVEVSGLVWGAQGRRTQLRFTRAQAQAKLEKFRNADIHAQQITAEAKLGAWLLDIGGSALVAKGPLTITAKLTDPRRGKMRSDVLNLSVQSDALQLRRQKFGWHIDGAAQATAQADKVSYQFESGLMGLSGLQAKAAGRLRGAEQSWDMALTGDVAADRGTALSLARSIPFFGDDAPSAQAFARAMQASHFSMPEMHLEYGPKKLLARLLQPISWRSISGAQGALSQMDDHLLKRQSEAVFSGGAHLALHGGGLPQLDLRLPQYHLHDHLYDHLHAEKTGFEFDSAAQIDFRASTQALQSMRLGVQGKLRFRQNIYTFDPDACAHIGLAGWRGASAQAPLLRDLSGQLCAQPDEVLFTLSPDNWRLAGQWQNMRFLFAGAEGKSAKGQITIVGDEGGMRDGHVLPQALRFTDAVAAPRFMPMSGQGKLELIHRHWRGGLTLKPLKGANSIARIALHHAMTSGQGGAQISSDLSFAPDGLQPDQLSPLLAGLSQAQGLVRFRGAYSWTAHDLRSSATLKSDALDFTGPLGAVRQGAMDIEFTSLSPLITARQQMLRAKQIGWLLPLSDLQLAFHLNADGLNLEQLQLTMAGGRLRLDPMVVALDPQATSAGRLHFADLRLGALVEASNLSDKIDLDAVVDGVIPFRFGPEGLRLVDGHFSTRGPARLSIHREIWTGANAAQSDAIRDFAYQALENLAIDALDARLNSLPAGRLGLIFRIKGRNDPAQAAETRIKVLDLLQGQGFDKPLPLPKGTPVDLTLDTSLNFDEVLEAYRNAFAANLAEGRAAAKQTEGSDP